MHHSRIFENSLQPHLQAMADVSICCVVIQAREAFEQCPKTNLVKRERCMHTGQSRIFLPGSGLVRVGILLAVFCAIGASASAQVRPNSNPNPGVIPPNSHPHGLTYGEWSARWWEWALEQPEALSPLRDTTGANLRYWPIGIRVVFGRRIRMTEPVTRMCTIPPGKTLFFPIANAFASAEGTFAEMQALL